MKIIFKDEIIRIPKNVTKEQIEKLNKITKMNIEITDPDKYKNVKKVVNYGAKLIDYGRVDGHLSIIYIEDEKEWTSAKFGMTSNTSLEAEYGFRFVGNEKNTDNRKYYF